ncbi:DUF1120 domain-containing protein [Burkholderia cepacia]|uniref:DUF1120 domain-containing protein n=1 Tax=Burkholderia cepacia TaxID=292 RepID=UPI002AB7A4C1|nr:DUF1120 domain-containing protein [Burkholderia cepacia]
MASGGDQGRASAGPSIGRLRVRVAFAGAGGSESRLNLKKAEGDFNSEAYGSMRRDVGTVSHPPADVLYQHSLIHAVSNERDIHMILKQLCGVSMLAYAMSSPGVASAADLSVSGQVRADGACSIVLGNGGVINLGNLSRKDFHVDLSEIPLTINCQHPTKVGVNLIDNRDGTQPSGYSGFGMGNPAIGSYFIRSNSAGREADGRRVMTIYRSHGGAWGLAADDINGVTEPSWSWKSGGTTSWALWGQEELNEPLAFKILKDTLRAEVKFRDDIAFTDELEIDGSATLELVYL